MLSNVSYKLISILQFFFDNKIKKIFFDDTEVEIPYLDTKDDKIRYMKVPSIPRIANSSGIMDENLGPVPITHGGIESGFDPSGLPVKEVLKLILYPYQYPSFTSFYIQEQPVQLEVGQIVPGGIKTFIWSTINDENIQPNSITIKDITENIVLASNLQNDGTEIVDIGFDKVYTIPSSHTWSISAYNTKGEVFSRNYTINWYYRVYWGTSTNQTLTEVEVKNLALSNLKTNVRGSYTFINDGTQALYYYIVYPDSWGDIASWTDIDTGFAVDYTYAGTVDVTNDFGVTTTYRLLRTTYKQTATLNSQVQ